MHLFFCGKGRRVKLMGKESAVREMKQTEIEIEGRRQGEDSWELACFFNSWGGAGDH